MRLYSCQTVLEEDFKSNVHLADNLDVIQLTGIAVGKCHQKDSQIKKDFAIFRRQERFQHQLVPMQFNCCIFHRIKMLSRIQVLQRCAIQIVRSIVFWVAGRLIYVYIYIFHVAF